LLPIAPLPLSHSWPLFECEQRLGFARQLSRGQCISLSELADLQTINMEALARCRVGIWQCDLRDNSLKWSSGVYDLFGMPRGTPICREVALNCYEESSRLVMEELRNHAIKHRRGFTLDVEIQPVQGGRRWVRLVAAPICAEPGVAGLWGTKQDVTDQYVDWSAASGGEQKDGATPAAR